jgi:two-component system chemotaxis response regulator CheY
VNQLVVLIVEDEPEVRAALLRDLAALNGPIRIDQASDVDDARAALAEADEAGDAVALVLADHRLPGESGVDLLVSLHASPETSAIRTILVTGQAGHEDTIRAINDAGLDRYFSKPWDPEELLSAAREQLTSFVIDQGIEPLPFVAVLDGPRLLDHYARRGRPD